MRRQRSAQWLHAGALARVLPPGRLSRELRRAQEENPAFARRRGQGSLDKNPRADATREVATAILASRHAAAMGLKRARPRDFFPMPRAKVPISHASPVQRNVPIPLHG